MCDFCIPVDFLGINDLKKVKKGRNIFLKAKGKAAMKNLIFLLFFAKIVRQGNKKSDERIYFYPCLIAFPPILRGVN